MKCGTQAPNTGCKST